MAKQLDNFFSIFRTSRIYRLRKGTSITFERGFFLVNGSATLVIDKPPQQESQTIAGPSLHLLLDKRSANLSAVSECVFLVFDQVDMEGIMQELRPRLSVGQLMQNLDVDTTDIKTGPKRSLTVGQNSQPDLQDRLL